MDVGASFAVAARAALGATFAQSAVAKLRHRSAFARALDDFGVPGSAALSWALPPVEAGLAVALLIVRASWPAFAAIAVLALFTGAVVANLVGGHPMPCPCFAPPAPGDRPVSARTVARNGFLVALAVLGTGSTEGASPWMTGVAIFVTFSATIRALRRFG